MKNIIERIAGGGAKIARYLPKAVSTRLAVAALAALAAGGAWATDSLEETGGFVTSTATLAFKNVKLADLSTDTLSAKFAGSWVSGKGAAVTFCDFALSGSTLTCEAQIYEATTDFTGVKVIYLTFTQSGSDINVQATNVKSLSGGTLGTPVGSSGSQVNSGSPATSYTGAGYGLYNLALPRSASDAIVIWDGSFGVTSKTGSDGNTYTLDANGNSVAADAASITINQSVGVKVDASAALTSGMTVLVRYSDLNLSLGSAQTLVNSSIDSNGTATGDGNGNRTGVYIDSSGASQGLWAGKTCTSANGVSQTSHTFVATETSGVMAFSYYSASTTDSNLGTHLWYLSNGTRSALYNLKTLGSTSDSSIYGCVIGGPRGSTTNGGPATGMKITGIAIFKGVLTESQMTSFVWPSASEKYSKFSYISAARRLTWTTASSVEGDIIANASTQYTVFDIQSGDNTATTYDSGTASGSKGHWHYVCYSSGAGDSYVAPGSLLRFVAGEGYAHSLAGSFSPLTLGGIIVEEGATGYSFAQNGSRYSIFGDPTNTTETYFDFYEDFTNARNAGCHLDGTINITVASGKTFTIAGTTTKCLTSNKSSSLSGIGGGTLKLHGGGHLAATLTASDATLDYTDLATTVSSSSDAYIKGTLTVNSGTVIALPAGATFPYYIATGISGSLNAATGVTIGGEAAPYYQANAAGYIEYVAPSEVTISSNATWGSGDLTGWATDDATKDYIINVTADATLTLPSAVSCKTIVFNVSDGVTLTLDGTYAITATDEIEINGANGAVVSPSTSALSGTLQGNGVYWLKNATLTGFSAATIADADLTLRLTGCTGYFNGNTISPGTLDLQDDGNTKAFTVSNCSSSTAGAIVFAKLTGSGTFTASNADVFPRYAFTNPSSFTGTFAIPASVAGKTLGDSGFRPVRIILGAHGTLDPDKGTITVVSSTTASIAAGKTWTAPGGIEVDGTLNLGAGATAPKLKSGSDGMVVVASGGTATVSGIDSSAISPTLGIMGTLAFSDTTTTELTLTAEKLSNNGTLDLSGCTAVTTMNLVFGSTRSDYMFGTITPPPNLATVNVTVTEVLSEDGTALLTIPASLTGASTLNVTVTGLDGTAKTVTTNVSGPVLSVSYTPTVSGAACWCAYEMEYDSANNKTGFENSGSDNTVLSSDGVTGSDAFTDDGMLYTYAHPWRNMTGDNAYPSSWTAVVRCTVPAYENAAVITFGTKDNGLIGLVAGANPETQMKLVKTTGNSAFTTLATMTVQNATTAQHVYVFSVENNQTIKVYCDGEQMLNETYSAFTLGGGIQVGSVHGTVGSTGIVRFAKDESPANTLSETVQKAARIDCVRLYKTVLGPNAIAQLSVEFPPVKLYRATVAANATTTWDALTWSPAWDGGNEYSKIILTTEGDATLTLPDSITADEFTINVASGSTLTLAKATGGTTMTVSKLEIDDGTVAVADANFFGSRVINGTGTLKITATGALTSALSGNAKFEIPSGVGVGVMSGGSIANAITGAGELAYQNPADVPATSLTFSAWTGTVSLPSFSASSGVNFNNYGTTGSTVSLAGMTGGYILEAGKTVNPTLRLDGAMNITAMSTWTYTFAEIDGPGALSFATSDNQPIAINITKVAEGYSGTISSTLETPVTIATLDRAVETSTAGGTKLLSTSGNVAASALTVGGAAQQVRLCTAADGIYVACTVTIPDVENASATVTVGGVAATGFSPYTVDVGSDVEITWTADSGYKITDGATQTINAIATDVTATAPTVEAKGATVSDVAFDYGKDFATATVTATVSGDATAYTLTVGGTDYPGTVDGTTVTFSNVVTGHSSAYDSVSYEIAATDGTSSVVVSGGSGAAPVADVTADWINERAASATGTSASASDAGGAWTNAVTYMDGTAAISDNRFVATTASTASRVVLEFNVCFSATNDADVDGTAQAAIKLGESGGATTFMVLASNAAWTPVSRGDFVPDASATYKVVMTIDYGNGSYGVTVGDNVLTNASGSASFPLAKSGATSVKTIDFAGSGTLTSMKGDQVEGYMVKDNAGHWYATIQAATQAYNSANGPYTVLHDGTAPSGWKIDGNTLIKLAKGFFFMAY